MQRDLTVAHLDRRHGRCGERIHDDGKALGCAQAGRVAVGDFHGEQVGRIGLRDQRTPVDVDVVVVDVVVVVDLRERRISRPAQQAEDQCQRRRIGVGGAGGGHEVRADIHGCIANRRQHRRRVVRSERDQQFNHRVGRDGYGERVPQPGHGVGGNGIAGINVVTDEIGEAELIASAGAGEGRSADVYSDRDGVVRIRVDQHDARLPVLSRGGMHM